MTDKEIVMRHYKVEWPSSVNHVVSLIEKESLEIVGTVDLTEYKDPARVGEVFMYNLHVDKEYRGKGYGRMLMGKAIEIARGAKAKTLALEWSIKEAPRWVLGWYTRLDFEEAEFGIGCALMKKKL